MKKVLIPTKLDALATKILLDHGGYEVVQEPKTPILDLAKAHPDAHALIVRSDAPARASTTSTASTPARRASTS